MRALKFLLIPALAATLQACGPEPRSPEAPASPAEAQGTSRQEARLSLKNADPTILRVDSTYISAESDGARLYVRTASSVDALAGAARQQVWGNPNGLGEVWAPEIVRDGSTYVIYFAAGTGNGHRMYAITSQSPNTGYSAAVRMALPGDKWAIDGTAFTYRGQRWFVWSGWEGDANGEQTLFIARMSNPTTITGGRFVISQPREWWEKVDVNPPTRVNEGPEAIIDPSGQLHVVYSANGSWDTNYCLADLRLRLDGDPTYVWDWFKSNGCLFGSRRDIMMSGWDPTLSAKGVGHHTFVLLNGDINTSPPAGPRFPLAYHGVPNGDFPNPFWSGRYWYSGSFQWWGNITYTRGSLSNTGWSLKFYE
ncbi:glycoside hydrolase family 43 protein [Corallococcus carmarthensis]|uniref:glycoside hydrolase family 43 protein n=1 Tax=Corallococcus carmarthensis TaxID=2316728 RepID=UPI00148DA4C9|nr:glycoside hydrolase family 43 protein [Corallococcus carmarthensis]NOK15543.1 family 43 glycosylhydrolase [Corallococcus carmarthensis]